MEFLRARTVHVLLFLYIAVSLTYQIVASVSLIVGYFDLRHQVQAPFEIDFQHPTLSKLREEARRAGLVNGDTIEFLNSAPYSGRAQWQSTRWYGRPGDQVKVGVRRTDGTHATVAVPLIGYSKGGLANDALNSIHVGEAVFVIFLQIGVPVFCLLLGYWVALARPKDPNAWFILILLSFPEAFISVSTYNWWPGVWLALRLSWHIVLEVLTPVALLWLGLLFPERSRIDVLLPWLKWIVLGVAACALAVALTTDYSAWYNPGLIVNWAAIDRVNDKVLNWTIMLCLVLYWVAIFDKLRSTGSPDARRRLRVLCAGSVVGLGTLLIIWGALPWFGIADPGSIQWLGYLSALLMLAFPFSLAYVVIVQRAMDVRILLRMGTKYALARTTLLVLQIGVAALVVVFFVIPVLTGSHRGAHDFVVLVLAIGGLIGMFLVRGSVSSRLQHWLDRRFFREAYNSERVLNELVEQARKITEPRLLIGTVSRRISEILHVPHISVLLRSGEAFHLAQALGLSLHGPILLPEGSSTIRRLALAERPTLLYGHAIDKWISEAGEQEKQLLEQTNAELLVPLPGRERLLGVMTLGPKQSEDAYSPSDLTLLGAIGTQTGLGLEIADLADCLAHEAAQHATIQRELEIAREVQERLFPQSVPAISGVSIAGFCRPAQGCGGDYYDFIELADGRLGLAIGDVSGKGIPAALLMAGLRACLRTMTLVGPMDLAQLMERLNELIYESSAVNRYATFFFPIYDASARKLTYVNAGHNPPFLLREGSNGATESIRLEAGGPVIGLLPKLAYQEQSLMLQPGDLLLTYTDGISEAMTGNDEEWGEERMVLAAEVVRHGSAEDILRTVFAAAG